MVRGPRIAASLTGALTLSEPPSRKQPITFDILADMVSLVRSQPDGLVFECIMSILFFGCLRAGELCVPDNMAFSKDLHVRVKDVQFNATEKFFVLWLQRSKTDKFNNGVSVFIGCSKSNVCAYCSLLRYLNTFKSPPNPNAPLFRLSNGSTFRKASLVSRTKLLVAQLGLKPSEYSGHSFRAGSASSASMAGFSDWEIKLLGRWQSNAYSIYLRKQKVAAPFAARLTSDRK